MEDYASKQKTIMQDKALKFILWVFGIFLFLFLIFFVLHSLGIMEFDSRVLSITLGGIILTLNRIIYLVFRSLFAKSAIGNEK